jgi:hypothetical protein
MDGSACGAFSPTGTIVRVLMYLLALPPRESVSREEILNTEL